VSAVTVCGDNLFHTSITRIAKNCAQIFTLESGVDNIKRDLYSLHALQARNSQGGKVLLF